MKQRELNSSQGLHLGVTLYGMSNVFESTNRLYENRILQYAY